MVVNNGAMTDSPAHQVKGAAVAAAVDPLLLLAALQQQHMKGGKMGEDKYESVCV